MELPPALAGVFRQDLDRIQEERRMPYVTSIERLAYEQGRREREEEGRRRMLVWIITDALEIRFGVAGKRLVPRVRALTALDKLRALRRVAWTAETLDEVKAQLRS